MPASDDEILLPDLESGVPKRTEVPPPDPMRRSFRVLSIVAPLSIVLAIGLNWLWVPDAHEALPGPAVGRPSVPGAPSVEVELEKAAIGQIPSRVLQYETITHQSIPGFGQTAGEAVYKTLNMNTEAMIPIVVYARVEGFGSASAAQARLDELMKQFTTNAGAITVNSVTPSQVGETSDASSYAVGWVRGTYATFVKASFQEWTPATNQIPMIKRQGDMVVDAVDVYQRTGREGVSK